MSAFQVVVDERLYARFDTSDIVSEGVNAGLGGVHFDDCLELSFAPLKLLLPVRAMGFAVCHELRLGVFAFLEHFLHVRCGQSLPGSAIDGVSDLVVG